MAEFGERIIVLIDMDCFYCQVEAKLAPELKGKPLAVIQYSSFNPGSIIAVNYEARDFGVTRHMKGNEAKEKCPNIQLVTVPPLRDKPDTGRYRVAGKEVIDVLKKHCSTIERASVDEAFLDITDLVDKKMSEMLTPSIDLADKLSNTYVIGYCDSDTKNDEKRKEGIQRWLEDIFDDLGDIQARRLAIGGLIVEFLRAEIYSQCEYRCSAGISYNKILAKLACGLHKPNKQTILPGSAVPGLYSSLPVRKVRNLGGKFGKIVMESLECNVMADLLRYSMQDFLKKFDEKTSNWLFNIARGIDNEPVTPRLICKSIGASKNFFGKHALTNVETLKHWINELSIEIVDRLEQDLEENERRATSLTISVHYHQDRKMISQSKACALTSYNSEKISNLCFNVITRATKQPIAFIGMSAGKFIPIKGSMGFKNFFKAGPRLQSNDDNEKTQSIANQDNNDEKDNQQKCKTNTLNNFFKTPNKLSTETSNKSERDTSFVRKKTEDKSQIDTDIQVKSSLLSTPDIDKALNKDNFKSSFFMNFLKNTQPSTSDNNLSRDQSEENASNKTENSITNKDPNGTLELHDSPDVFDDLDCTTVSEDREKHQTDQSNETNNAKTEKDNNNVLVQLKEIFPDLDNIDQSVIKLLPIELQREANAYLKANKKEVANNQLKLKSPKQSKINGKNSTAKSNMKSKISGKNVEKNNSMYNFIVKSNPNVNNPEMKQCTECHQMIRQEKYGEHLDYHVAKNLQKVINQLPSEENSNLSNLDSPSTKRKINNESNQQTNKKARSIESFFT
ncbi:DNA polymerase eta [Chelonus insularis]|uniref:DNA polymerase eta n=1 Tax=Chelonus insularis TaxID=460826 RepID=UPI00158D0EDF|nr:DNA polymerase eta [Chelonus insularis]